MPVLPVLLASGLLAASGQSLASSEQATCTYDDPLKTVTITIPNTEEPAFVLLTAEGGVISYQEIDFETFEFTPKQTCGAATTTNTDLVRTQGGGPNGALLIADETTGPFAPGFTAEGTGVAEIEFEFQPIGGVIFGGSPTPAVVRLGTLGANINGDDDVDVTLVGSQTTFFGSIGSPGADDIAATGGFGTGDPSPILFSAAGGDGNDHLVAGTGPAGLNGFGGDDIIVGGPGGDSITGDAGNDRVSAGPGADDVTGGGGNDTLRGGPSRDLLNGGSGRDKCVGGPGKDLVTKCER